MLVLTKWRLLITLAEPISANGLEWIGEELGGEDVELASIVLPRKETWGNYSLGSCLQRSYLLPLTHGVTLSPRLLSSKSSCQLDISQLSSTHAVERVSNKNVTLNECLLCAT